MVLMCPCVLLHCELEGAGWFPAHPWRGSVPGRIPAVQVQGSPEPGGIFWGWKFGHNYPLDNGTQKNQTFQMSPLRALLLRSSWIMPFSLLEAFQNFQSFFSLSEFWNLRVLRFCFVSFYLFLTGFVQKSDVHKLFITSAIHEFSFPLNFYECFLC